MLAPNHRGLTPRQWTVVRLIAVECLSSKEAADKLGLSYRTIEIHRTAIMKRLQVKNVVALARLVYPDFAGEEDGTSAA